MSHWASPRFWETYAGLPENVRKIADRSFELLKKNPQHPSLNLKRVGRYWSARVELHYRALAVEIDDGLLWFWIGHHAQYDALIRKS